MRSDGVMNAESAALRDLYFLGKPTLSAVCALMEAKLAIAHVEMETAKDQQQLFRAQGRAQIAREILRDLTRGSANSTEIL